MTLCADKESDLLDELPNYKRSAVRYVRNDISAFLTFRFLLKEKTVAVKLLDITSKGASILTIDKLTLNKKIRLILTFKDGKQFAIRAKIVRIGTSTPPKNEFGVKFDQYNDELGDYLLATQDKLIFK